nr:hypothetical protein [Tanacetum cinerariifolium]
MNKHVLLVKKESNIEPLRLMKKMYCLVVTDDYSRFTWVFFLSSKDETSDILKSFITRIENLVDHKAKVIRYDNGTEFKNKDMNQFCKMKGIIRQYSVARTPQQNKAEAVSTACCMQNRVLVTKPHNKTSYKLLHGRTPALSFMRPFGSLVTILNTIDHLGKFDGNADEGFFVGYFLNSKAFRVFNSRTRIVEETLHIRFSENTPNNVGSGPNWLFDIDALTQIMNYHPVVACTQSNSNVEPKSSQDAGFKPSNDVEKKVNKVPRQEHECKDQEEKDSVNSTNRVNAVSSTINVASNKVNTVGRKSSNEHPDYPNMPELKDVSIFEDSNKDVFGAEADLMYQMDVKSAFLYGKIKEECKKQTVIGNSTTEAEYVAASSCCGQFWTIAKSKTVNGEVQIHALVDGMKVYSNILDKQLDGLPTHKEKYDVSFHTKKVFSNMKRIDKGFSGEETPLFPTMVGPNQVQMGEGSAQPTDTQHTPMPPPKPKKTQKPRQPKRKTNKVPQPSESTYIAVDEAVHKEGVIIWVISSSDDEALDKDDTSKQGSIDEIDADEDITLVITTAIIDVPVSAAETIVTTAPTITAESTKTNVKVQDKGKGKAKLIEEPEMPKKRKHQIIVDKELAKKLQAEMQAEINEEDRLARERELKRSKKKMMN